MSPTNPTNLQTQSLFFLVFKAFVKRLVAGLRSLILRSRQSCRWRSAWQNPRRQHQPPQNLTTELIRSR